MTLCVKDLLSSFIRDLRMRLRTLGDASNEDINQRSYSSIITLFLQSFPLVNMDFQTKFPTLDCEVADVLSTWPPPSETTPTIEEMRAATDFYSERMKEVYKQDIPSGKHHTGSRMFITLYEC